MTAPPAVSMGENLTYETHKNPALFHDIANEGFHLLGCCAQWFTHFNSVFIIPFYTEESEAR